MRRQRRDNILTAAAAVLVILLGTTAVFLPKLTHKTWSQMWNTFTGGPATQAYTAAKPLKAGSGVTAYGKTVPISLTAEQDKHVQSPYAKLPSLLPSVLHVSPDGDLQQPATLTFTLSHSVDPKTAHILVVSERSKGAGWELHTNVKVPGTSYVPDVKIIDATHVAVTTSHFSWWDIRDADSAFASFKGAFGELKQLFLDGIVENPLKQATAPKCSGQKTAEKNVDGSFTYKAYDHNGHLMDGKAKNNGPQDGAVLWCYGMQGTTRTVTLVNREHYPIDAKYNAGFSILKQDRSELGLTHLADPLEKLLAFKDTVVLLPYSSVTFKDNKLADRHYASVTTSFSGTAMMLYQLEEAFTTALAFMDFGENIYQNGKLVSGTVGKVFDAMGKATALSSCTNAIRKGEIGGTLANCMSPEVLWNQFGAKALLLAPVMAGSSLATFFVSEGASIQGRFGNAAKMNVEVVRFAPEGPKFDGKFIERHGMWDLTFTLHGYGAGTFGFKTGACSVEVNQTTDCYGHVNVQVETKGNAATVVLGKITYVTAEQKPIDFSDPKMWDTNEDDPREHDLIYLLWKAPGFVEITGYSRSMGQGEDPYEFPRYVCGPRATTDQKIKCASVE